MLPTHFYYFRKSIQSRYSYTPTGDLDINRLLRNKPYWRQSLASTRKETKTLLLADWTAESWSTEKRKQVIDKLVALINVGFSLYAWQAGQIEELNKDNLIQLLNEPQFLERMISSAMPKEMEKIVINQLPNATKDSMLILDDHQIKGLLNPEVFNYPRELDIAEVFEYKQGKKHLISTLGKMDPAIKAFTDTHVSDESYELLEELQTQLPEVEVKSQFKKTTLTTSIIDTLLRDGEASIARRLIRKEQLNDLEEVTLNNLSVDALTKILPYLSNVKKLTLLNFQTHLNLETSLNLSLPNLEKIKLIGTYILTSDLVAIIKNSSQLKKLAIYYSSIVDNGSLTPLSSSLFSTIKSRHGSISKKNFQDLFLHHKINRVVFSDSSIISDSLTEIKERADLSAFKVLELENSSCDADYLNQMFLLLPNLEHVRLVGGSIKPFTNTFSLKFLKTLEIDLKRFNEIASAFDNLKIEKLILIDNKTFDIPQLNKLDLSQMTYFKIANNHLNHPFIEDVLKRASHLKHLDLQGCTNLARLSSKLFLARIDTLNLSQTDVYAESLEAILENAPHLKRLDLSGCSQLVLTPKLRALMNHMQVYYPDHIKIERKKPDYSNHFLPSIKQDLVDGEQLKRLLDSLNHESREEGAESLKHEGQRQKEGVGDEVEVKDSTTLDEAEKKKLQELLDGAMKEAHKSGPGQQGADGVPQPSQDEFVDATTGYDETQQSSVDVTFFPIDKTTTIPAVSQYREKIFNDFEISQVSCPIKEAFKVKQVGDLQLQECEAKTCAQDVLWDAKQLEQTPEHQYFYGKTSLRLTTEWQALPSLSAQEQLTHYHIEPSNREVELKYSLRDNQYYIRSKESKPSTIAIDFLLKIPNSTKKIPLEVQQLVDKFAGSIVEPGFDKGSLTIEAENPTGMDYLNAILTQKKGACRHRAIAFYYLMKERFPSLPVRIMANTVHMQTEVQIDGEWISCNLGGYPMQLNLNTKYDPQKEKDFGLKKDGQDELLKEDAQLVQFLQTWKKSKQPELALNTYCEQLTEPRQQKKYLVETNNSVSLQALALAIKSHCREKNRPFFYISKPDHLSCSAPYITNEAGLGVIHEGPGGPLHDFLTKDYTKANPPILILNSEQFDTDDLVQHNSLLDDIPKIDGTALPEGTIVLLLRNSSKPNFIVGEDLSSRIDVIEQCPVADKTLNLAYPPLAPKQATPKSSINDIDLFRSENWESLLLGQWIVKSNSLHFEQGLLQEALKKGSVLTLKNGLWENPTFQHFWQEVLEKKSIDYEGQHIELPQDFELLIEEGYHWEELTKLMRFKEGVNPTAHCLNPNLFNSFFFEYETIEAIKGMKKTPGLIQRFAGQELIINLTRELDEHDWARLLSECKKYKVRLVCHCSPGIDLPAALQHQYPFEEKQQSSAFSDSKISPCMVIKSSDRDTTVSQLTQKIPEAIFIDASELESFDLLEQVHGAYDKEKHQFQFTRIEKLVNKALRENKNIILTGQCSNTLLDALMPLLLRRVNTPKAKGSLTLVVDDNCEYKFPSVSRHEVTLDEKMVALKLKHADELITRLTPEQLQKESLSQLSARLRYLKKHPSEDSAKAWDGLHTLSSQIQLAPFDLNQSEEKAKAIIKELTDDILVRLADSPILYLSGLTGVGKTTFVENHLGKEPNVTLYNGEEQLKSWAEDKSDKLKVLFIDEANINQRQWSEFEGLFVDPPSIVINGQHYWLNKDHSHVVVFAGNPLSYGNDRQLATLFKRHGNAKVIEPMTGEFIYEKILKPLFEQSSLQASSKEVSERVLTLYRYLVNLSTNEVLISARELQLIVLLILASHHRNKRKDLAQIVDHYIYQIGSTIVPYEHKKDFDALFKPHVPLYPKQPSSFKLKNSNYLITPSRQEIYQLILDLLQLRDYKKSAAHTEVQKFAGICALILEGEPGIGKSELVRAILQAHLFQEATLSKKPKVEDIFYQIPIGMRKKQKKLLFREGLVEAAALIIDEMNSAPIMERWQNDLLMNKDPITKMYPEKPGLILFGTQNPVTMAGRQKPSNAVKRRALNYSLPNYPPEEMAAILVNEGCTPSAAENMVRVYVYLVNYARKNYLSPAPTFRDLLRLARISSKLNQIEALNTFYASVDKTSLRQLLIKAETHFDSETVLALAHYLTPKTQHIFDLHPCLFEQLILKNMNAKKVEFLLNFLMLIMPTFGEIDKKYIEYFDFLCDTKMEKVPYFDKLNEVFALRPSMMDDFFRMVKTKDFATLANLVIKFMNLSELIAKLLSRAGTELLSLCMNDSSPYLSFIGVYMGQHPETSISTQLALIEVYHFLLQQNPESKDSWEAALLCVNQEKLIKVHETISTREKASYSELFHSMFNLALLTELKNDEKMEYIKLMLEDEPTRKLFQLDKTIYSKVGLVRKYMAKFKTTNSQEVFDLMEQFQDYPELVDYLFSNETSQAELFLMCKAKPKYYADLLKAYMGKQTHHYEVNLSSVIKLLQLSQMLSQLLSPELSNWRSLLLESKPTQIIKMHGLFAERTDNKIALTQCIELYQYLNTEAGPDQAIWFPTLQSASPAELNKMHQWMNHYRHDVPSFLNLIYSNAHALTSDLTENSLFKYTDTLLNRSPIDLFNFNKPFKFNADRVRLLHHLEKKTFVVPSSSMFTNLWTELKNSTLLNAIYDAYLYLLGQKKQDKETVLLIAKELTAVPKTQNTGRLETKLKSELSGVVTNYLHSFWIRTQRKNSARSLLSSINSYYTDYVEILNSIQTARNEVFTNDTGKERHMHRFGSSRYYQTLNQLEDILIHHWIQDKNAISNFQVYLNHYESTLNHSKHCFLNAIQHENEEHYKHYNSATPFDELPGYIRALKREVELRDDSFKKYKKLLMESMRESESSLVPALS